MITKGSGHGWDVQWLVAAILTRLDSLECLWWIEWLPSEANPSDPLSRFHEQGFVDVVDHLPVHESAIPRQDLREVLSVAR